MTDVTTLHRAMFDAVQGHDWSAMEALFHPEYIYSAGDGEERPGTEAALAVAQTYTAAFPDLAFEIEHQHSIGNISVAECRATGTHKADLPGIPATGRHVDMRVCNVIEERDGQIVREREYYDSGEMMRQLGVSDAAEGEHAVVDHRETIAAVYSAFGRGDVDFIIEQLAEDVAWDVDIPHWGLPWYEARSGRGAVRDFFDVVAENLTFETFEPIAMLADEDQIAAVIRLSLMINATGKRVSDIEVHLWTFDGEGRISRLAHIIDQHGQLLAYQSENAS